MCTEPGGILVTPRNNNFEKYRERREKKAMSEEALCDCCRIFSGAGKGCLMQQKVCWLHLFIFNKQSSSVYNAMSILSCNIYQGTMKRHWEASCGFCTSGTCDLSKQLTDNYWRIIYLHLTWLKWWDLPSIMAKKKILAIFCWVLECLCWVQTSLRWNLGHYRLVLSTPQFIATWVGVSFL